MTAPVAIRAWRERRAAMTRAILAPPPKLTVSEWADLYRMLSRESSAEPGKWRTARAPYQRGIMDAFSEPLIERVIVMSSAQVGKTEILNNIVGFFVDQDPAPILVLQPTLEMAKAWSTDRLATMLRDTPRLRGKVKDPRSRDSGNTILHKQFPGGHLTVTGANSAAGLRSRPIRVVLADEVDAYPPSAGTEGDPVTLAIKRTSTFWNRKVGLWSTPTIKDVSRIEREWADSDQRHFEVPCPHCAHFQPIRWKDPDGRHRIVWETGRPETAAFVCEACGALIDETEKLRLLDQGRWVARCPGRRVAGFHLNAFYSPWKRWEELVVEFLEARDQPERLKVWINTVLGETWEERGARIEAGSLLDRRETYPAEVPAGARLLTAAVDVQDDRLELAVKAWGAGEESWLVRYEQLWGDPGRPAVWQSLEHALSRAYAQEGGGSMRILAACVDSGGHHTEMVYRFTKPRESRHIYAVKGMSQPGRALLGRPGRGNKMRAKLFPVGTETAKDLIFSRLRITVPGPGYCHFPAGLDAEYFAQLTAEKVVTRYVRGRPVRIYEKTRPRNEALDLEVYNLAALASLGPAATAAMARPQAVAAAPAGAPDEPPPVGVSPPVPPARTVTPRRRSSWVNGWR